MHVGYALHSHVRFALSQPAYSASLKAVAFVVAWCNTFLNSFVPFHYMLRVLQSDVSASKCLQDERCSLKHAAVFPPPLTSNPILNNELDEADVFCNQSLFLQTCELELEEPIAHVENSRSEDMFSTVSVSELEKPFSHTQQCCSIDDSTCSNGMFARVSMLQVDKAIFQPNILCQTNRTVNRMFELSQTEPLHDMDVALSEDVSACASLSHVVQGLGSLGSAPQGNCTAWLRGLTEPCLHERSEPRLRGLPQVIDVEPQSPPSVAEPSASSDPKGLQRPSGGSAEAEGLPSEDLFEDDVDLEGKALDAHRARGHFPFMRECVECRECKGMIPARSRRSKAAEEHLGVGADFVFFGRFVRIALFLALGTGMICAFRVEKSEAFNITQTVLAFKELGGTGHSVELLSDCADQTG